MVKRQQLIERYPIPWTEEQVAAFRDTLLAWYDQTGRDLPWRQDQDPYKIWVSEIMLQQTQVATVIPYYYRFIEELPDVAALAQADEDTLLGLWQGLGYYSRVKNMKVAAQQIETDFAGEFPQAYQDLLTLKGIGPYTAGAIASIAFNQAEPAMDGNLIRIVSRLFEIEEDVTLTATQHKIRAYLYQLIDPERPGDFNQALMDMGAMVMTPHQDRPDPHPLKDFDQSYQHQTSHLYPVKKAKLKASKHTYLAYVIQNAAGQFLMRRHTDQELLSGLWHFPLVEQDMVMETVSRGELIDPLWRDFGQDLQALGIKNEALKLLHNRNQYQQTDFNHYGQVKHVFSHRIWQCQLVPLILSPAEEMTDSVNWPEDFIWIDASKLDQIPISTLQKKLLQARLPFDPK
ncbi:A/G-specific adenine glycosylase [Ignavigranum ruoffiae]|uniref:Adenine DNA glycosylase n=1 Tax=Ignavigranum ruoffiae TaxID=89093 RepID=A0A1H9AZ66_9LACT|nr:A/G-specific adenine glycosylase [Ignavigranum ruoffiae]UPQ85197.1 A/G-specific adenine glycosylase [Ignavigranum ruoffiae]SEP81278.1 A/G-specific DNA-adenine glycosylase [Ignavigranum ruoffiae]